MSLPLSSTFPLLRRSLTWGLAATAVLTFSACDSKTPPPPAKTQSAATTPAAASGATATKTPKDNSPAKEARRSESEKERSRQAAAEMVPVETALVTRGAISAFLSYNSTVETEAMVDIYPQTTGQVEALLVEEGRVVQEGEPLLKIEDRELRVEVEESTANFAHLERNFGRSQDLYSRNLINKQDYENQRYQVEQARLRLERAKIRLAYATVRAPFAGVISSREAQVGARVASGTKLFSMVKLDELVTRVYVPGRYLSAVQVDQPAVVTSEFMPNKTFNGWVKRISPVVDPKSGTFKVTVGLRSDKTGELPPGLFVGVRVITDTRTDAVLVPKRAVIFEGGERYVYTVVNDRAVKKKLTIGYEDPNHVESIGGSLEVGTPVIVLGQSGLKDGSLVRSVNAAPAIALPDASANKPDAPAQATSTARPTDKAGQ